MTEWHRENGYIRNFAIIAAYEMANYLYSKHWQNPLAQDILGRTGAELNEFQFMRVNWELTNY